MKNGQVALALAGGYLLGRFHKMRLALAIAGVAAGKRLRGKGGGLPTGLLKSPEMERLAHDIGGELLTAGRTAAVSAVGTRMNELSDRIGERAASLREPPGEAEEGVEEEEGEEAPRKRKAQQSGGGKSRRVSRSRTSTEGTTRSRGSSRTSTKPSSSGSRTKAKRTAREEASDSGGASRPTRRSRG